MKRILLFCTVLWSAGVAALAFENKTKLEAEAHIINLDAHGNLRTPEKKQREYVAPADENRYFEKVIEGAEKFAAAAATNKILIFIHGGLNGKRAGERRFNEQAEPLMAAGYYPIYILWPSGIFDAYGYHLARLRPPEKSNGLEKAIAAPLNFLADSGRAVVRAPLVMLNLMRNDFDSTIASDAFQGPHLKSRLDQHRTLKRHFKEKRVRLEADRRGKAAMAGRGLVYFVTLPGKLATAPIIDAFGKSGWHEMYARLDRIASRQIPHEHAGAPSANVWTNASALARFFDRLEHSAASEKTTLAGHSMGAILINKVLPDYKGKLERVIFLAAACSIDEFERGTLRYLERQTNTQFLNMTLHPAAEARELDWRFLDLIPRGSLLVWIDEFLDQPRAPGQRRLGKWQNFYRVDANLPGVDNSVPFAERVTKPPMFANTWVRGFGVGDPKAEMNGSLWNEFVKDMPENILTEFPETHSEMARMGFWRDEYLYNESR